MRHVIIRESLILKYIHHLIVLAVLKTMSGNNILFLKIFSDYCFQKFGSFCSLDPECTVQVGPPEDCNDVYYVSQGYRLVPGTKCDVNTGLNLLPKKMKCPSKQDTQTKEGISGGMVALIVILVLGAMVIFGIGGWFFLKKKNFGNFFGNEPKTFQMYESGNTALDDDLLESKEAEPLDEETIEQTLTDSSQNNIFI